VKVLQAAKEHAKKESVGRWRSIRSRLVFRSTSPDTSPPADELMDVSALAGWSPQVRVFLSLFNCYIMWKIQLSSDEPLVSFCSFSFVLISICLLGFYRKDTNSTWLYSDPRTLNLDRHGRVKRPALESVQRFTSSRAGTPLYVVRIRFFTISEPLLLLSQARNIVLSR
jgi:hypothetical protein